ncbi:MAG: OmpH family outer membrane protein [Flavobacteriales bacterium]|nr:OmpH family outer membrane protein [Flavobacteriales bacterium]
MRKVLFTITFALTTLLATAQNMAHMDTQKIIPQLPDYTQAQQELEAAVQKSQEEMEFFAQKVKEKQDEYVKLEQQCQKDPDNCDQGSLQLAYQIYEDRLKNFEELQYKSEMELQNLENTKINKIVAKIQKAAKTVAEEKGYVYVFDINSLLVAGGEDITDLVLAKLLEGSGQ